jgi:NAD(P)-dependent dehydrogenase (short-subunit alcohol dehydrogenase family)/acyl carrier protein
MPATNGTMRSDPLSARGLTAEALGEMIVSIIAEVTRYPRDILQPDAVLEEDLGIDSVKRAEILAVLRSRLDLPETDGTGIPPLRTIADVTAAVESFLRQPNGVAAHAPPAPPPPAEVNGSRIAPPAEPPPAPAAQPAVLKDGSLGQRVVEVIAEVTRYPRELLRPEADVEEDLGFDAPQLRTIFAALRVRLAPSLPDRPPLPTVHTVADIVAAVQRHQIAVAPAPAPRVERAPAPSAASAKPFAGKVALVTGSGRGIGKALAAHLAGLGATVVVNSFHSRQRGEESAAEIIAAGGKAVHLWGSVTNPEHLDRIFQEIDARYGGLDFLISNASNGILAPVKEITPEHWDRAFRTNVIGLHQASLKAAGLMRRRGGGKIVALSSVGAQRYLEYLGCIGTVKAAVESLVRYLAVELGGDNIQVNAVSAGPVYGELMEKYPDLESLRPRCEALTPRGRLNDEQEVAEAVTFLLGSNGMSGSVLLLDAGGCQRIRASTTP